MYATVGDFIAIFGTFEATQLTHLNDPNQTEPDESRLERALADSSDLIDGYLRGRYPLPLVSIPRMLVSVCCDIARYRLCQNRLDEEIADAYKAAIKTLESIAKGVINLALDESLELTPVQPPRLMQPTRIFTAGRMSDYAPGA
ncbi:MAG: DUF1320 domain-containing protein [Synechococcales cyanobacterium]